MGDERAKVGFIPCLWCASPIPRKRALDVMQAGAVPLFCSDRCRSVPERSFVKRMYDASETAAEEAGFADFAEFDAAVRANFSARRRAITSRTGTVAGIKRRTAVSGELDEPAVPLLK